MSQVTSISAPKLRLVESPKFDYEDYIPPLIPPGEYEAVYVKHRTAMMFGNVPKLVIYFRIITFGDHFDSVVPSYYGMKNIRKNGGFTPKSHSSKFMREYVKLFGKPRRIKDVSISPFKLKPFVIRVRTVIKDSIQCELTELQHYSAVAEIVKEYRP